MVDLKKLQLSFKKESKISWPCPNCNSSTLKINKDKIIEEQTAESQKAHDHPDWGPEFIRNKFAAYLKCSNCREIVMVTGDSDLNVELIYEPGNDLPIEEWFSYYYPTFFEPPLHFFPLNDKFPENIRTEITKSFRLFWCDLASCANRIRTTLELLLNEQGVKIIFITRRRKRKKYTLHARIEEFKKKNKEVADYLLAIKWIGNTGSHQGELHKEDILEAYQLLEHSLLSLYDNQEEKLRKISKEINSRKGIRKRKK